MPRRPDDFSSRLHEQIINRACREDGWHRSGWKAAFRATLQEPAWADDAEDILADIDDVGCVPDAWRLVVEGPGTPDTDWGYEVLVLEFLEVEIAHPMPMEKRNEYQIMWWRFDATDCFHFRVYVAGHYGEIKRWLDAETIDRETRLHLFRDQSLR